MEPDEKLLRSIAGATKDNTSVIAGVSPDADALLMAMQDLEAEAEKIGWDQPAECFAVFSFPEALGMRTFPMPDEVMADMGTALPILAEMLQEDPIGRELLGRVLPENFFGMILMNEGWMVAYPTRDIEPEWIGRLDEHPRRREGRFVLAYTLDGRMTSVTRVRGEFPASTDIRPEHQEDSIIPAALKRIVAVCKEVAPSYVTERQLPRDEDLV